MEKVTNWEDVGLITSSTYRKRVLERVQKPNMPSILSKELNLNKTHISRALKELLNKALIECKNPKTTKGRIYEITTYGKKVLKEAEAVYGEKWKVRFGED